MPKRNDALSVPCPFCNARVGQQCTGLGDPNASHWSRHSAVLNPQRWDTVTKVINGELDAVHG